MEVRGGKSKGSVTSMLEEEGDLKELVVLDEACLITMP